MIQTFESDPDGVKVNQSAKYLFWMPFSSKVGSHLHYVWILAYPCRYAVSTCIHTTLHSVWTAFYCPDTQTHTRPIAIHGQW